MVTVQAVPAPLEPHAAARVQVDRRQRPTPAFSRYWLRGRRRAAGRRGADSAHVYVDRYSRIEWALVSWLVFAAVADLVLTLWHIREGGGEANPVMDWFLQVGGEAAFSAAKLGLTLTAVLFLLLHARFRGTRPALFGLSAMYLGILGYHVVAILDRVAA